jgi:hypothetical protein
MSAYPGRVPLVTYSALRLGLLAACFALGYWAGLRTWLLLGVAVLAAWALSYILLAGPRDAAARYLAERAERRRTGGRRFPGGSDDDAAVEDALDDRARSDPEGQPDTARPRPNSAP